MTSVVISQLICTMAIIVLIIVLPFVYTDIKSSIRTNVMKLELQEIADYVSSTFANTYFLINSTDIPSVSINKTLVYLPSTVEGSYFRIRIDGNSSCATSVSAYVSADNSTQATAWLPTGLKGGGVAVNSGVGEIFAGCMRNSSGVCVLLGYEEDIA